MGPTQPTLIFFILSAQWWHINIFHYGDTYNALWKIININHRLWDWIFNTIYKHQLIWFTVLGEGQPMIQFNYQYSNSNDSRKMPSLHSSVLNMTKHKRTEKINFTVNKVQFNFFLKIWATKKYKTVDVENTYTPLPWKKHYRTNRPLWWAVYITSSLHGNEIDLMNLKPIGVIYWYAPTFKVWRV